jgi:hypothetical protein
LEAYTNPLQGLKCIADEVSVEPKPVGDAIKKLRIVDLKKGPQVLKIYPLRMEALEP